MSYNPTCVDCAVDTFNMTLFINLRQTARQKFGVLYCLPCWHKRQGLPAEPMYGGRKEPNPSRHCSIQYLTQENLAEAERQSTLLLTCRQKTK